MNRTAVIKNKKMLVAGALFFCLCTALCPIIADVAGIEAYHPMPAYGQEKAKKSASRKADAVKSAAPRQITDFTGKKEAKADVKPAEAAAAEETPDAEKAAPAPAAKEETDIYKYDKPEEEDSSYGWLIFKTILVLGLFGAAFYFFFKYVSQKGGLPNVGRGVVQTLAVSPVGPNKSLHIVDIAGRVMVLGVTDSSINLISEVKERDEIDRIKLMSSKSTPVDAHGFQDFVTDQVSSLIDFIGRTKKAVEEKKKPQRPRSQDFTSFDDEQTDDHKIDYMREQRERLKRLNGYHDEDEK